MRRRSAVAVSVAAGLLLAACGSSGGQTASTGSPVAGSPPPASPTSAPSGSASPSVAVTGLCANDYFPVVAGATWTYRHTVEQTTAQGRETLRAIGDKGFTAVTTSAQGSERDTWICSAVGLADVSQHVSGSGQSITFGGQTYQTGVQNFHDYRSRGVTIPARLHVGSTWTQVVRSSSRFELAGTNYPETQVVTTLSRAIGRESVATPAGTFDAVKVETTQTTHKAIPSLGKEITDVSHGTIWVVRGVGIVESTTTNGSGFVSTTILVAYHVP